MPKKLKINNLLKYCYILAVLIFIGSILAPKMHAQQKNGITVVPSIAHIDLATDPAEYELTYINNTNAEITLNLSVQDFSELEDSYKLDFLSPQDASNYKYSLSSWISFENPQLQLNPGEKKSVKVFIDKTRITKGGHYASILAQIGGDNNAKTINVKGILSSLLFVRASTGQEVEDGKISDFSPLRDGIDYPTTYILRFENNGNVYVTPYGLIQVYDPLGNLVAKGILNQNSLDSLPESIRRYDTDIINFQPLLLPGFYTAKIQLHYGKTNQKLSASTRFFSQGMFNFPLIGLGLVVILLVLLYFRKRLKRKSS
jgi:hypothetical protein